MKSLFFPLFIFICLCLPCCKPSDQPSATAPVENTDQMADTLTVETSRPGHQYTDDGGHTINMDFVRLNKGAKWEANVETTNGIGVMTGMINSFNENPTLEDYRALHKQLATRHQSILQKCTMKGEAHLEFKHYMGPLKEKIDLLGNSELEKCKAVLPDVKEYLGKYSHFFFS